MKLSFLMILVIAGLLCCWPELQAKSAAASVPVQVSAEERAQKRLEAMQYAFNYAQQAAAAQKLRAIKHNARRLRLYLKSILEEVSSAEDDLSVDEALQKNRMTLAAQEVNDYANDILAARNVANARRYAKKAMETAQSVAFPEKHSLFEIDLDYDNLFKSQ